MSRLQKVKEKFLIIYPDVFKKDKFLNRFGIKLKLSASLNCLANHPQLCHFTLTFVSIF